MGEHEVTELVLYVHNDAKLHERLQDACTQSLWNTGIAASVFNTVVAAVRQYHNEFCTARDQVFSPEDILAAAAELAGYYTENAKDM